ncbi:hypothetical protein L596_017464 [Steinernema carpocapsae]|nr:hypothetical protein L596_017464 [Steinernema carpocapsae]
MLKENKETYKLANFDLAYSGLYCFTCVHFPLITHVFLWTKELFREVFDVAERFQCNVMKHAVETYLLTLDSNKIKNWLSMADQFGLNRLTHKIVKSMTKDDIAEMRDKRRCLPIFIRRQL